MSRSNRHPRGTKSPTEKTLAAGSFAVIYFGWRETYPLTPFLTGRGNGDGSTKCGERVEVRREKKPLPGMLFLLASGTKKILTRQEISIVYPLLPDG